MMEDINLLEIIFSGTAGIVFSSLSAIFYGIYKVSQFVEKYRVVDKIESGIEKIKEDIQYIKANVKINKEDITYIRKTIEADSRLAGSQSPVALNDIGLDLSQKLGAKEIINKTWQNIEPAVERILSQKADMNTYTIQEACFEIGRNYSSYFTPQDMDKIKTVAFSSGFNLYEFDLLFGIEIRDKYFKDKNIKIADIDKDNPKTSKS